MPRADDIAMTGTLADPLAQRVTALRAGQRAVDLGAAPGGWLGRTGSLR